MPIRALKVWAHKFGKVVLTLEDPCKKKEVGLICPIDKINDELTLTSLTKVFTVKDMREKIEQDNLECWNEFFELMQIDKDKLTQDSQMGFDWTAQNLRGQKNSPCQWRYILFTFKVYFIIF